MRNSKGGAEIDKYKTLGAARFFLQPPNVRKTLKKVFPVKDLRCEAALDSAYPCTNPEGVREAVISSTLP